MINNLQAHHLLRSLMKSELLAQAELTTGERLTVNNAPQLLAAWSSALANGDSGPVLDALAESESAAAAPPPPTPDVPAGAIPYDAGRCFGKPQPSRWRTWTDMMRKSYLARQVSRAAFRAALSVPEAGAKLGVTPWVLYGIADPRRYGKPTPDAFVRHGQSLGVDSNKIDQLKKLVT